LLKVDFIKKCADGLRKIFRSLTKVLLSKESLSPPEMYSEKKNSKNLNAV
jgi:hypothetical protein